MVERGNLQLSHGGQVVETAASSAQCCWGLIRRQNKVSVKPFLLDAHRAKHDPATQ